MWKRADFNTRARSSQTNVSDCAHVTERQRDGKKPEPACAGLRRILVLVEQSGLGGQPALVPLRT